ncbi:MULTISPECIES: nitroreductase family deazaflavin-dependent oxidoreductase [Tsukamurella]|uniref:Nitroreductase family deazaflavin-dependent oxidoreductase n=2 Tax=Tsukamurella TaxID=2060 RepID=A0A5C5RZS9_9ACTN|nr:MULTISPECIES: nitroreductase family deazaflavin-dependent oxidoreductase [Tsukamurella]NMD54485.1 nitroreductase family deazaflavin-dependent oxidoreductase [Tsukamurella columbiensis]TWS28657.1 nitroreductase family deazaflavin-dependent oxidoreductase [Tsukamurella conjunctivitidis]
MMENLSPTALAARALRTRRLVRAPIWLFRHGLGPVLGPRMVMIQHTGRKSGEPRFVVLEVVDRPDPDTVIVCSGFGETSQWYRNLRAQPECRVTVGRRERAAHADLLGGADSAAVLDRYRAAHPAAWERLRGAIEHAVGHTVDGLPMVRLRLH